MSFWPRQDGRRLSRYPAGYKENAGIFAHNNPWVIIGETVLGRGDRAWEYYRKICPAYVEEHSDLHKVEPYVYCQMTAGKDAARPGEAKNSWLTGTGRRFRRSLCNRRGRWIFPRSRPHIR